MPQTTTNLGKVLIVSKGDHNPSTLYERLDTVSSNGSTFICLQDTTVGVPITDTVYWSPFAKSAYQNWLDAGNIGTYQDFLTWLQVPAEEERQAAEEARDLSRAWASNPENQPVSGSLYSSRHYMEKALDAQSAAEQAKTLAETAWDNFDDTYLGAKATDPTTDNDGGVLKVGAMYFNSVSKIFKVWDGSAWVTHPALESVRSQSTTKAPTSKLLDDEMTLVGDNLNILNKLLKANYYLPRLSHIYFDDSTIARKQPETLSYNGTTYYVDSSKADDTGNGLTPATAKKTIMAAYNIASNGCIIQLSDGTYDLSSESGGYCLFNTTNKGVLIQGNSANKELVILSQTSGSYAIRFRNCGAMMLKDLTISTSGNSVAIYSDYDAAYSNTNQLFNNCIFNHSGTGRFYQHQGMSLTDTKVYNLNFIDSILNITTSNDTLLLTNAGNNFNILFSNCTINRNNNIALKNEAGKANLYIYSCRFVMSGNYIAIQQGKDTLTPAFEYGIIDVRQCTVNYDSGLYQHGILFGRGISYGYCINNYVYMDSVNNSLALGIVIKSRAENLGNVLFYGNYIVSPRPCYIKGGSKNDIRFNTFINSISNYGGFEFTNYLDGSTSVLSNQNNFEANTVVATGNAIQLYNDPTSEQSEVTIQNNTLKENRYFFVTNYLQVGITTYSWENRQTFWNPDNDIDSLRLTDSNLPIKLIE